MAQRAYAGFTVQIGMIAMPVDAVPVRVPNVGESTSLKSLCMECEKPHLLSQKYVSEVCKAPPRREGELTRKARQLDDDTLVELTAEEIEYLASGLADNELKLRVVPAMEMLGQTLPDGTAYRLRPKKKGTPVDVYAFMRALARNVNYALVGRMKLKGHEKLFRLTVWRGQLLLQGFINPEDIAEGELIDADVDEATLAMGQRLLAELADSIDEEEFRDHRKDRLAAIVASKQDQGATVLALPTPAEPETTGSLLGALEASLAAVKAS